MFGILVIEQAQPETFRHKLKTLFFRGYIVTEQRKAGKASFTLCRICCANGASEGAVEELVLKGIEKLKTAGAFRIIADKKWHSALIAAKLAPMRTESTLKACATKLVLASLQKIGQQPKSTALLVYGSRATKELGKMALKLGSRVKFIHICSQCNANSINRMLMQELGIAESAAGQTFNAAVIFDSDCFTDHKIPAINLTGEPLPRGNIIDFTLSAGEDLMKNMPEQVDPTIFCTALYLAGAIATKDITFGVVDKTILDRMVDTQYNKG